MQCLENNGEQKTDNNAKGEARKRSEDRGLDKEEEDYFNEDRLVIFCFTERLIYLVRWLLVLSVSILIMITDHSRHLKIYNFSLSTWQRKQYFFLLITSSTCSQHFNRFSLVVVMKRIRLEMLHTGKIEAHDLKITGHLTALNLTILQLGKYLLILF